MSEKREPLHPVKPPQTAAERAEWGKMRPPAYPPRNPGLGGWLIGVLTAWKR